MPLPAPTRLRRGAIAAAAALALTVPVALTTVTTADAAAPPARLTKYRHGYTTVQLLSINDLHGNLEPPAGSSGMALTDAGTSVPAGGAAYLATRLKQLTKLRDEQYTVKVAAGDLIGASPLTSALFHDEPTIEFLNQIGLFASSTGNHEYDEGITELKRMQDGGCHPTDGCFGGDGFAGASFTYLSANVTDAKGKLVLPAYAIKKLDPDLSIGFIGLPLKDTPGIVTASGVAGLRFGDEVAATNAAVRQLQARGVRTIVLLLHQGDETVPGAAPNNCGTQPGGAGRFIAEHVSAEVDAIISAHSHQAYNCVVRDPANRTRPFVQGASFGRYVTELDLTIDRRSNDVTRPKTVAYNHIVTRDVPIDAKAQRLIQHYQALSAPIAKRRIGSVTATLGRTDPGNGEEALGDVVADAQLDATAAAAKGGAVAAFMNPGGLRTDLTFASSPAGEGDGVITYAEAFAVQPFTNYLTTISLTGTQIDTVLEQQFDNPAAGANRFLQVSQGFSYAWSKSAPKGSKVDPASITINGVAVDPAASYRITVNNFLSGGGDGFSELAKGTSPLTGAIDLDSFVAYAGKGPIAPPAPTRIVALP